MIDDFLASRVNAITSPSETVQHETLDTLVALAQLAAARCEDIRFRKDDFVAAFKTLPIKTSDLEFAVAAFLAQSGEVKTMQLLSCPFGSVASVHAWERFGASIQVILSNVFSVPYARYVDDLFGVDVHDPTGTAALARWVIEDLLGPRQ